MNERRRTSRRTLACEIAVLTAAIFVASPKSLLFAQQAEAPLPAESSSIYEELPELTASDILKPELLSGPHHKVREPVPTASGMNQFVIDSDYGVFPADGNEMLLRRINEIYAIARLKEVSRTDQFTNALMTAAKGPLNAAKNIVKDPVGTVSNVPKGVMKFMGKAGNSIKNIGKKSDSNSAEGSKTEQLIGYAKVKRKLAVELGVDPYTTNATLQKQLDEIAWASWAGGFTFSAATFPISGPVGAALTVTKVSNAMEGLLKEKSVPELKEINRAALRAMGAGSKETERLLSNDAFSPSQVTEFVLYLKSLDGVADRAAFVRTAAEQSSSEADAIFCLQTAKLMSQINKDAQPLARIAMVGDFPVCVAKDGTIIVALQWDYAAWTSGAATFIDQIEPLAHESGGKKSIMVVLSGEVTPRLHDELQKRGITLQARATAGPLK